MKTIALCVTLMIFAALTVPAGENDVIVRAQSDAAEDGRDYRPLWWGAGGVAVAVAPVVMAAFFADALPVEARRAVALTVPVAGAAGLALVGYCTGQADVPGERIGEIRSEYSDSSLVSLYESEYKKTLTSIQRRKRGNCALFGSGVAIGAMGLGFLFVYLAN